MNLVSNNPAPDGSRDILPNPTSRPDILRGTGLQLNNLGEQINRATDAFTRLLGEVSKAVGRYGSVQLENLQQMPIFPEPIRALMGMLTKSPEALAAQLNRMIPNHAQNRQLANGQSGWVDATNAGDRTLLGQLAAQIDRVRGNGTGPAIGAFFSQLAAAVGTNANITLADVVTRARALAPTAPLTAPAGAAPLPAPTVAPAPAPTEVTPLGANETLRAGDKRTLAVPFATDVSIEGQTGRLAGSTVGTVTINGLKLTRNQGESTVTIEVATGAAAGRRSVKFGTETRILTIRGND